MYPEDNQVISVLGTQVQVWRGVRTYSLSAAATPIANRGSEPCGYTRAAGRGHALLLGTWPVADSVPGREGDALEVQDLPAAAGPAAAAALATVARVWGAAAARSVDPSPPPQAGTPRKLIVFDYSNERRGGEVITGGTIAYWDGDDLAPIAELNLADTVPVANTSRPEIGRPPFRPITRAHVTVARALHGRAAACEVSDRRAQARLLLARDSRAGTISVVNRYDDEIALSLTVAYRATTVRVPSSGTMSVPAGTGLVLPLGYDLGPGVAVERASVQLLDGGVAGSRLRLTALSYGGEVVLRLPGRPVSATVDGRAAAMTRDGTLVCVAVPPGTHDAEIAWSTVN
jgi:hypothetical protein